MAPPSRLPSANEIAKRAKDKYSDFWGSAKSALPDNIEEQATFFFKQNELSTVYLNTLIDRHAFAGPPNDGHAAIADLMISNAVQTVVTTNVDTLIENAGIGLFGQVEVGIDGYAVAGLPSNVTPMLKLHGCRVIDWNNTIWTPSQLHVSPNRDRLASSIPWIHQRLLSRDILVVGYWTDWDYINLVLESTLNAVNPTRVVVVDPADSGTFASKAPALYALGERATNGFFHVRASGAQFLGALREKFSQRFVREILRSGAEDFKSLKGVAPDAAWLEPPSIGNAQLWLSRRDILGCPPNSPATQPAPPVDPLLGLFLLELQAAGATPEGSYWKLGALLIRVLRAPNQLLHKVKAAYDGDAAPSVAADYVVAIGAISLALPTSIVTAGVAGSIAGTSGGVWLRAAP